MAFSLRFISLICLLFLIALLPFFEGGETATGLFLIHSITLLGIIVIIVTSSRLWIPRFMIYFLPFLLSLIVSVLNSPYKFAAFLQFWDYCIAGLFAIQLFSTIKENEKQLEGFSFYVLTTGFVAILISIVLTTPSFSRLKGSFLNPNDFATFSVLLLILAFFQYEHESNRSRRITTTLILFLLGVCIAMASSRSIYLATSVFLLSYLWKRRPGRVLSSLILLILVSGIPFLAIRFYQSLDPFLYYRAKIWKHSLQGILQDPYLGIGLNMLPYRAAQFNFPSDDLIGRYSMIATSADNQYLQILAETGFLGFFTFLVGWTALCITVSRIPNRFSIFRYPVIVLSIIGFFSLPLNNTAVLFLFLFLTVFPLALDDNYRFTLLPLNWAGKTALVALLLGMLTFAVFCPYAADLEYRAAIKSKDLKLAQDHVLKAVRYNPYQPYYTFSIAKLLVDEKPQIEPEKWLSILHLINKSIELNPLDSDFYAYKAKVLRNLHDLTHNPVFYSQSVSAYQAGLQYSPYNVFLRMEFAFFQLRLGRLDLAEIELQKILSTEPIYLNARYVLTEVKFRGGNISGARAQFAEAERYYHHYRNFQPTINPVYVRKLLEVNPEYRERVKRLLFDVPTN